MAEPSQDPEYLVGLAGNSGLFGHPGDMSGGMWVFYFLVKYMIFFFCDPGWTPGPHTC